MTVNGASSFRAQNLISLINRVPEQFETKTIKIENNIYCGKTADYYKRKLKEIVDFISNHEIIYFA